VVAAVMAAVVVTGIPLAVTVALSLTIGVMGA